MKAIKNVRIVRQGAIQPETVLLYDEKIIGFAAEVPAGVQALDGNGLYLSAGFIDIHIHGYRGKDTMLDPSAEFAPFLPENGVTAFLPTTMTESWAKIEESLNRIRAAQNAAPKGARVLGCHLEGPFISPAKKGAQDEKFILPPEAGAIAPYRDVIRLLTYAPEQDPTGDFPQKLREMGIVPSLGHTNATCEEALTAYKMGAMSTTHLFNAMSALQHREPGVPGAALSSDAYVELIADTIHVDPRLFPMLARLKPDRLCLITDCMEAGGLPDGRYALGGQPVEVKGKEARLLDGTLAGSVLRLKEGVRNMARYGEIGLPAALRMATENPARLLGVESQMGTLQPGTLADFILLDDTCEIYAAFVGGREVYKHDSH